MSRTRWIYLVAATFLLGGNIFSQSVLNFKRTPWVVTPGSTASFVLAVQGDAPTTAITFEPAWQLGVEYSMLDNGVSPDTVAGDKIFSITISTSPILANITAANVHRPFMGYVKPYSGSTPGGRYNTFAEVASLSIPRVPVTSDAFDVQHTSLCGQY